ncbi:MAG TPA: 4-hydroxythreonine-4-phosphate dehydrogenase PdxA, partial [Caldilineaceae bacterium]|nr:4-hydroxythreonine-4-phosphate dehydrogenase PdxA [Caldilineaceae bacterium]
MNRPILAITIGDPAGVGPEIVVKALTHKDLYERCRPLVIGDQRILTRAAAWVGQRPTFELVSEPEAASYTSGTLTLLDLANADPALITPGKLAAEAGRAAVDYVFRA